MFLENITLRNFRNYDSVEVSFNKGLNFLIGGNTQGKSNLIEAINLLLTFRSPRTNHYEDMIKWEANFFYIKGTVVINDRNQTVEVIGEKEKGKRIRFNQKTQMHPDCFKNCFPTVIFTPEDFNIIKGPPANRRDFLDFLTIQTDKKYFYFLKQYQKVLCQKNIILQNKLTHKFDLLESWNNQLIDYGTELIIKRNKVINRLKILIKKNYPKISIKEDIEIIYETFLPTGILMDKEKIKEGWQKLVLSQREEEIKKGMSLSGPHRDNIIFLINGRESCDFASQGQIKTILLALNLAEIDFIYEELDEFPVVLLDELFSELDDRRIKNVLDALPDSIQIFITEIDKTKTENKTGSWFRINQGVIEKEV